MKFDLRQAALSVLVFLGAQRIIDVIADYFIKPNIPNHLDPQERDAIRLTIEILIISIAIFVIKKFC